MGALYLWQIRQLKRSPVSAAALRMPPLERLDRINFLAAAAGFLAATVNRVLALMTIVPLASLLALRLRLRDGKDGLAHNRPAGT